MDDDLIKIHCKNCQRYLGSVSLLVGELVCANSACKMGNQFKILTSDTDKMLRFKFTNDPKPPKKVLTPVQSDTNV